MWHKEKRKKDAYGIYDMQFFVGPFEFNKWSGNRYPGWNNRFIETWRYHCPHGVSGLGIIIGFKKTYIGFGTNWCVGLHGGCDDGEE